MSAPAILVALAFIALFVLAHRIQVDIAERRHRRHVDHRVPPYGPQWPARSDAYFAEHPYCENCHYRPEMNHHLWRRLLHRVRKLWVHHVDGNGVVSPSGHETDDELMTLCYPCHMGRVHAIHKAMVRAGRDRYPYEHLRAVTMRVHRHGWWRRALRSKPPTRVAA